MSNEVCTPPYVAATQWIESHQPRVEGIMRRLNIAYIHEESSATIELILYIIGKLDARNGSGVRCPLHLAEFQSQQLHQHGVEPEACAQAWQTFDWQYTVTPPRAA